MLKKIFIVFMALAWLAVIAWFSLQPKLPIDATSRAKWALAQVEKRYTVDGVKQAITNRSRFIKPIVGTFFRFYNQSYANDSRTFNFIVRKIGHFTVYFFLGIFLFGTVSLFSKSPHPWTLLIGLLLALFDELNQFYSANRVAMIQDVLVDFAGILAAVIFVSFISLIYGLIKKKFFRKKTIKEGIFEA